MIVASSTVLSRRRDQSNHWCFAPLQSSMRLIHINGLFAVVAQFCGLVAINCRCHRCSLLRLDVGHEYCINNVVVPRSLLASLMRHKKRSPHRCRWGCLRLRGWLPLSSSSHLRNLFLKHFDASQWWPQLSPSWLVMVLLPGIVTVPSSNARAFATRF